MLPASPTLATNSTYVASITFINHATLQIVSELTSEHLKYRHMGNEGNDGITSTGTRCYIDLDGICHIFLNRQISL